MRADNSHRQRAPAASLQQRLQLANERIRQLDADNRRLRNALAQALGDHRTAPHRDTPTQPKSSARAPR